MKPSIKSPSKPGIFATVSKNPVELAAPLAKAKFPILHIVSENDRVLPPAENTYLLQQRLEAQGHTLDVISVAEGTKATQGHHFSHPDPHGGAGTLRARHFLGARDGR